MSRSEEFMLDIVVYGIASFFITVTLYVMLGIVFFLCMIPVWIIANDKVFHAILNIDREGYSFLILYAIVIIRMATMDSYERYNLFHCDGYVNP